jgi:hypothetical protein
MRYTSVTCVYTTSAEVYAQHTLWSHSKLLALHKRRLCMAGWVSPLHALCNGINECCRVEAAGRPRMDQAQK